MKRLARLGLATGLAASLLLPLVKQEAALATPFSDVPANHWAYQYIQSLAADGVIDGYPDGKFKGDRPLTRYEMAVVVARVIAKLQENQGSKGPSKEDLDKLQKLIDSLKDELDALGVRVTNLEDSLDALDKRTKFAQSLSLHGVFLPNLSFRQRPGIARSVTNTTGANVTTYYGATAPGGSSSTAPAVAAADPFVNAFLATDDSNNPLTQAGSGVVIRQDSRFSLAYQINDNLTVSLPVHILNYEFGGDYGTQNRLSLEPGVDISIAKAGAVSNLQFKYGIIDNMTSSRLGVAFRAPQGYNGAVPYIFPNQPFQKGAAVKGTVAEGAFGTTDFEASFTRVDQTLINTQLGVVDPNIINLNANVYFGPVVVQQVGFTQVGAAGANKTDTFNAGNGSLAQVFLTQKAILGSVYVSAYNGASFDPAGNLTGGTPSITRPPNFTYNDTYNDVVFSSPVPAGSVVSITYRGVATTNNTNFQRYMVHSRLNQKFKSYAGAEVGLTFTRIFDFDDAQTTGSGPTALSQTFQNPVTGNGAVSDTVLGLDFQVPLPFLVSGPGSGPILFGEAADSKYTADFRNLAAVGDTAGVLGVRVKIKKVELSAQYQSVGSNFFVGAPFKYYGNAPPVFASYKLPFLPDFFGFGNNIGINSQFDGQFANSATTFNSVGNPNLSFVFPIFNPLKAQGPEFFSSLAPNSRGFTTAANAPIRVGDLTFTTRFSYQHLEEIRPNTAGTQPYGPAVASNERLKNDTFAVGTAFALPVFGQTANVNFNGAYETLKRLDTTGSPFVPFNPASQGPDAAAAGAAAAIGGTGVSFHPNYINMRHITLGANVALPLTKNLVGSAAYSTQRFGGSYGTTVDQNISERKDYYTGAVTYNIPKTNSSVSFLARHYGYLDEVVPNSNLSQNRQDLNFTVRF